jgi:hypothetical protein
VRFITPCDHFFQMVIFRFDNLISPYFHGMEHHRVHPSVYMSLFSYSSPPFCAGFSDGTSRSRSARWWRGCLGAVIISIIGERVNRHDRRPHPRRDGFQDDRREDIRVIRGQLSGARRKSRMLSAS